MEHEEALNKLIQNWMKEFDSIDFKEIENGKEDPLNCPRSITYKNARMHITEYLEIKFKEHEDRN